MRQRGRHQEARWHARHARHHAHERHPTNASFTISAGSDCVTRPGAATSGRVSSAGRSAQDGGRCMCIIHATGQVGKRGRCRSHGWSRCVVRVMGRPTRRNSRCRYTDTAWHTLAPSPPEHGLALATFRARLIRTTWTRRIMRTTGRAVITGVAGTTGRRVVIPCHRLCGCRCRMHWYRVGCRAHGCISSGKPWLLRRRGTALTWSNPWSLLCLDQSPLLLSHTRTGRPWPAMPAYITEPGCDAM
jgi:hypothetical protein